MTTLPNFYLGHAKASVSNAYREGFTSYPKRVANPYKPGTDEAKAWLAGREEALRRPTSLTEMGF